MNISKYRIKKLTGGGQSVPHVCSLPAVGPRGPWFVFTGGVKSTQFDDKALILVLQLLDAELKLCNFPLGVVDEL